MLGLSLSEVKMLDFCDALLKNNPVTGNFGSLVALTVAAVDEVRRVYVSLALCALCLVGGVGRRCFFMFARESWRSVVHVCGLVASCAAPRYRKIPEN